jgi:hypothetical protein
VTAIVWVTRRPDDCNIGRLQLLVLQSTPAIRAVDVRRYRSREQAQMLYFKRQPHGPIAKLVIFSLEVSEQALGSCVVATAVRRARRGRDISQLIAGGASSPDFVADWIPFRRIAGSQIASPWHRRRTFRVLAHGSVGGATGAHHGAARLRSRLRHSYAMLARRISAGWLKLRQVGCQPRYSHSGNGLGTGNHPRPSHAVFKVGAVSKFRVQEKFFVAQRKRATRARDASLKPSIAAKKSSAPDANVMRVTHPPIASTSANLSAGLKVSRLQAL